VTVLHPACGKPVRNRWHLRTDAGICLAPVKDVEIRSHPSPGFSTPQRRFQTGPSEVLRMIRSPYSYNLSLLKTSVMIVAPRSTHA
jgi:hypothetical protein